MNGNTSRRSESTLAAITPMILAMTFCIVGPTQADPVLEAAPFSIGLGASSHSGSPTFQAFWTTNETAAANTFPVGNISLILGVTSEVYSSAGPTFPSRVLTSDPSGLTSGWAGQSPGQLWAATISAVYTGPVSLPPDATILIQIDSISIYGVGTATFTTGPTADMGFAETTPGHAATSPSVGLTILAGTGTGSELRDASNYTQLLWNPADFTQLFHSATRTFGLSTDGDAPALDGFEISGTITVFIPEPNSLCLALIGAAWFTRWRRASQAAPRSSR